MSSVTLDLEFTRTNLDHDGALVKALMQIAVEDLTVLSTKLRSALKANETDQLRQLAHAIKGLASNFRAEPLTRLADQLEKATLVEHQPTLTQFVDELSFACSGTALAINTELHRASN